MRLQTRGFQQTDRFRGDCHAPCWGWCLVICALIGYVGKLDLASSGPFSAWPHPAASTIEQTSPASPSLPGEKIARSRANDGVFRQSLEWQVSESRHMGGNPCGYQAFRISCRFVVLSS